MRDAGFAQRLQVVAAFQHRDDAALRVALGERAQLAR